MSMRNGRFLEAIEAARVPFDRARRLAFANPLAAPLALSLACSVLLIERRYGLIHNGFLSTAVLSGWQVPVFLAASAVLDLSVLAAVDALWALLCRLIGAGERRRATGSVAVLGLCVAIVNTVQYNVLTYLGDWMHLRAAVHTARGVNGSMPFFLEWLSANGLTLIFVCGFASIAAAFVAQLGADLPDERPVKLQRPLRRVALFAAGAVLIEVVICHAPGVPSGPIATSLRRTSLQRIVEGALAQLTDWDGDGVGWIDHPADFAPFDPARSPFAVDVPGDGIDEDGIGGDLPAVLELDHAVNVEKVVSRPDILVVVPCSLRADALSGGPDLGPGVMPFLAKLAQQGLDVDQAYSHCGHTISALQQILTGQYARRTESLIRDMKRAGYRTGVISTQDESFGATEDVTGMKDADFCVDAKADPAARVTSYSTSSSIILPAKWAIRKADEFLAASDPSRPVFLFVHLETCHYPYFHDSPDEIVPHPSIAIGDYRPENRGALVALYRNAAANLDRRLAELYALVEARRPQGRLVSILMADHGESLFDDGLLGHGTAITDTQMRVPCVIVNGWGTVPSPFGHTDIRPFLLSMLATAPPTPTLLDQNLVTQGVGPDVVAARSAIVVRRADRPLFQWVGSLKSPNQLGLMADGRRTVVDLGQQTCTDADGVTVPLGDLGADTRGIRAIQSWESLRIGR